MKEHKSSFDNYDSSLKAECDKGNENLQSKTEKDTQDLEKYCMFSSFNKYTEAQSVTDTDKMTKNLNMCVEERNVKKI